jgi:hypothetical protein
MAARDHQDPLAKAVGEFLTSNAAATPPPARATAPRGDPVVHGSTAMRPPNLATAFDAVLADEARKERERLAARDSHGAAIAWWLALVLILGASGYIWFGHPAFLATRIDPPAAPVTPIASRRTLVSIALLIEDFRVTSGHLPHTLAELGVAVPAVGYTAHSNGEYELRLGGGVHGMILRGGTGHGEPALEERAP